jgi:hypothetical protein
LVAAQAAAPTVAFIDRSPAAGAVIHGILELVPDCQLRRRTWQHPSQWLSRVNVRITWPYLLQDSPSITLGKSSDCLQ